MLFGNPLKSVSLLKIPKNIFIQEKSTKENFVHRKTTEIDSFQGKVKKINSNNKNSEKTLFKNWKIEKKEFLIFLRPWEQNKLMEKHCNKFVMKIFLAISFMRNISVEIVLIQKLSWKPI